MFERVALLIPDRNSVVEAALRALFERSAYELVAGYVPHAPRPVAAPDAAPFDDRVPGAARLERLLDDGAAQLGRAVSAHRDLARAAAEQAEALAAFARNRPSSLDRPDDEVGAAAARTRAARPAALTAVSEWAVDEVAVALRLTSAAASGLLVESLVLVERLPATLAALQEGRLSWRHAQVLVDLLASLSDELRPIAEARLLARAEGKTSSQLRVAARRVVQQLDAEALARRVVEAIRGRRITVYPGDDGMATLSAVLPTPVARAVHDALRQYAGAAGDDGDERTLAQRMVDCLVDLVLRPGEHGLPPVQARLTVVAAIGTLLGSDEPGEVDGDLVPAEMVRQLAVALGLLPSPERADAAGSGDGAEADRADASGAASADPAAVAAVSALLRTRFLAGTALAHRPHIAVVDELTGQLVALSDAVGMRRGTGLGPPPESLGYRPEAELDRFVRLRDRRCRFPGCRARPIRCDLDHTVPFPWGPTNAGNLCCLCRHHHRLSHQAPGWRLRGVAAGGLEWTTPGGIVTRTYPPRFGADDDLPGDASSPPGSSPVAPPAEVWVDEPPPF